MAKESTVSSPDITDIITDSLSRKPRALRVHLVVIMTFPSAENERIKVHFSPEYTSVLLVEIIPASQRERKQN